jgi:hypothetical protein
MVKTMKLTSQGLYWYYTYYDEKSYSRVLGALRWMKKHPNPKYPTLASYRKSTINLILDDELDMQPGAIY